MDYHDFSQSVDSAHRMAEIIQKGNYSNVFYFEFHQEIEIEGIRNWEEGLEAFSQQSVALHILRRFRDKMDGNASIGWDQAES